MLKLMNEHLDHLHKTKDLFDHLQETKDLFDHLARSPPAPREKDIPHKFIQIDRKPGENRGQGENRATGHLLTKLQ